MNLWCWICQFEMILLNSVLTLGTTFLKSWLKHSFQIFFLHFWANGGEALQMTTNKFRKDQRENMTAVQIWHKCTCLNAVAGTGSDPLLPSGLPRFSESVVHIDTIASSIHLKTQLVCSRVPLRKVLRCRGGASLDLQAWKLFLQRQTGYSRDIQRLPVLSSQQNPRIRGLN